MEQKIHEGRNVKRFREMLGIKQDALAYELGEDWNQQRVSLLEQKEIIDAGLLQQISDALKIPVEVFKNFDEEQAINVISNTFNNEAFFGGKHDVIINKNPLDEIKKLHEEKMGLYERMLKEKEEMILRLESLLDKK